ncbi:unnamed protein product [Cylicocyclus nassatus]|uniref:Uncharacterized protein n=1 Tax=Cylicocyclus nassatus TaxID=53992 RepID=A0AA36H8K1_CYLNA|nr:unnamed protein product [Cylicocyclus nassatus]
MENRAWATYLILGVGIALAIAGSVMLGVGISRYNSSGDCTISTSTKTTATPATVTVTRPPNVEPETISQQIRSEINPGLIKQNLRDFTKFPHMAGTDANANVADLIVAKWTAAGLKNVHKVEYDVLLSYPPTTNPNLMTIESSDGTVLYTSEGITPAILPEQNDTNAGLQWLAFSPNGNVVGDVVYCGFGTDKEFQMLEFLGISVKGRIALIRYGGAFRGDTVAMAQKYGAKAAILYSDPAEVAPKGTADANVYANTVYMPPHAVQRGTVYKGAGDPLSPLYPSKSNLWRSRTVEQVRQDGELPSIPVLPISYFSAQELISRLSGPQAPSSWKGDLNADYNLGPGLKGNLVTRIKVGGRFERKTIQNVIGYIKGAEEPERYVILGNHYDAWIYGAMDPNAGTAVLAEVARATTAVMSRTGWRPARSIMFAAWDAEEYGLVGSVEFVEEFAEVLNRRAVAYLNMDCLKGNQTIYVQCSPSLQDQAILAAKNVPNPRRDEVAAKRTTVYDTWINNMEDLKNPGVPAIDIPFGGSDHKSFLDYLGVPSLNFAWIDMDKHHTYPLYHTLFETPFTSEHLMDTDNFAIHTAIGQYWIELAVKLADAPTIPYSLTTLSTKILRDYIPGLAEAIISTNLTAYTGSGLQQLKQMTTTAGFLSAQLIFLGSFEQLLPLGIVSTSQDSGAVDQDSL